MSRYTLVVRADRYVLMESVISKLPSHHVLVWAVKGEDGWGYQDEYIDGAVQALLPVGRLATLVPMAHEEGTKPTHYILSGEFTAEQERVLRDAVKSTKLVKDVTWWEVEGEAGIQPLVSSLAVQP